MKRDCIPFFFAAVIGCMLLLTSCNASKSKLDTLLVENSLDPTTLEQLDIEQEAIAPLYLPSEPYANSSYHKSGLTATIETDNNIIVNFEFYQLASGASDEHFPSPGEALVTQSNDTIILYYRMSDSYGCIITSDLLSKQELEKIINSFTIRSIPAPFS